MLEGDEKDEEKLKLKKELDNHYKKKREGLKKRINEAKFNFALHPTKILIEKILKNENRNHFENFVKSNGEITKDNQIIMDEINLFYQNLLGKKMNNDIDLEKYSFKIKNTSNIEGASAFWNKKITFEETFEVIKYMNDSSPGDNGLTLAFYKKFFHLFGQHLIEIYNDYNGELPDCLNCSITKLIPKNKKVNKSINDLRPISMTNLEYRIFTKILANRLKKYSHFLFKEYQTCSIPDRKINDSLNLIRDIIFDSNIKGKELYLVSADQKKAFDSISHEYIFNLLEHMRFGPFMTLNMKRLYKLSYTFIEFNGKRGKKIEIKRGIKQGCALSMFLYTLAIEEMLIRTNENDQIKGYKTCVSKLMEHKTSAYADDVAGTLINLESIDLFMEEFQKWGKVSGASLNKEKTKILAINSKKKEWNGIPFVANVKILGIVFDRTGIGISNITEAINKLKITLFMWNNISLNILERITVVKTFAFSKILFVMNFCSMSKVVLKSIEKIVYGYIWNGKAELISRVNINRELKSGGLKMMDLNAKYETVRYKCFLEIIKNIERPQYQIGIFFLRDSLRNYLKNINITPVCSEKNLPEIYKDTISIIKKMRILDKSAEFNKKITSKYIYSIIKEKNGLVQKTSLLLFHDKDIFKNIHKNIDDSNIKIVNYRALYDSLPTNHRFKNKYGNSCYLCGKKLNEDLYHIFEKCSMTELCFSIVKNSLEKEMSLSVENIIHKKNLKVKDYKIIAAFMFYVWKTRNIAKYDKTSNNFRLFKNLFLNWKKNNDKEN